MGQKHHTSTFENIPPEKRERILRAAAEALGREGIAGIRMADIAAAAGISHGSLFSYFPTKDHLVRAIIARGTSMERDRFASAPDLPFAEAVAASLESAWETASDEGSLISLWLSLSLPENGRFAEDILPLEREGAERWKQLVESAQEAGTLVEDTDSRVLAFLLDAAAAQLMKSQAGDLERRKFALFFEGVEDPARLVAETLCRLFSRKG